MGRARKKTVKVVRPDELPAPWLVDSEFLLNELARLRELILRIPIHNNTILPTNTAIDSVWRLEQQLRYLLHLHKEGQRSFARKADRAKADLTQQSEPAPSKIALL